MIDSFNNHNLIDDAQHGFQSGRSVISASVAFIETIIESLGKGESTITIFVDISKAFHSVNH